MTAFHNILIKSLVGKLKKKQIFLQTVGLIYNNRVRRGEKYFKHF